MKKIFLTLALVLAMSVPAFAASSTSTDIVTWPNVVTLYPGTQLGATSGNAGGVVWSRHNLSSYGEHLQAIVSGYQVVSTNSSGTIKAATVGGFATTEVCVFCHTPHWGATDTGALWNKKATGSYTPYKSPYGDTAGVTAAGTATGPSGAGGSGASLACLSCHDGVTQIDALINKPGAGSTTNAGSNAQATTDDMNWTFREMYMTVGNGAAMKSGRLQIGVDLTNDHPLNVVYSTDGRASLRAKNTVINSITMSQPQAFDDGTANVSYGRSDNIWSVFGYLNSGATINDLLSAGDKVECGSCHDPHYKNQTNNDPVVLLGFGGITGIASVENDGLFLRRAGGNSNSGVCRTCHNK